MPQKILMDLVNTGHFSNNIFMFCSFFLYLDCIGQYSSFHYKFFSVLQNKLRIYKFIVHLENLITKIFCLGFLLVFLLSFFGGFLGFFRKGKKWGKESPASKNFQKLVLNENGIYFFFYCGKYYIRSFSIRKLK